MAVQKLKPRIELIKARYGEDKEKVRKETSLLYEMAGVNPLAGCLPSLATIPIFIGLYR
jgi:YidC/Oxa1 family membrane protein insertase